jgi:hypothetical protein
VTAAALWDRLRADGHVEGDYAPARTASPWFVRVMLGFAGWIGAFFLLSFIGAAMFSIIEDAKSSMVVGAILCGAALFLFRAFADNDFVEQLALAVSLAGQGLIVAGLAQTLEVNKPPFHFALAGVEAVLIFVIPNFLHRVIAAAVGAVAVALGMTLLEIHGLSAPIIAIVMALIWLSPRLWARSGELWRPIGYGLVLALLLVEVFRLFDFQTLLGLNNANPSPMERFGPLVGRAVTALILVAVALVIGARERSAAGVRAGIVLLALIFGTLSLAAPGLASAVLILLLGFAAGNRLLMALGVLALLGFVSHFYYSLHATLLEKSGLLALTGVILLFFYFVFRLLLPVERQAEPADA